MPANCETCACKEEGIIPHKDWLPSFLKYIEIYRNINKYSQA
jgi:hypothetical protein